MADEKNVPNIYPGDSTKALLGLAMALIHEIKHHQGYDGERFAGTLKLIAAGLKPDTPGLSHLMKTFETMIDQDMVFGDRDGLSDKT